MSASKEEISIIKNAVFLNLSTVTTNIIAFIVTVMIGRYLGEADFGLYVFVLGMVGVLDVFTELGSNYLVVREVARDREGAGKYLYTVIILKSIFSAIVFAAVYIFTAKLNSELSKAAIRIMTVAMIMESFGTFFDYMFNAFERMEYTAFMNFLLKAFYLLGVFWAIRFKGGVAEIFWARLLAAALYALTGYLLLVGNFKLAKSRMDIAFCKGLLRKGLPFMFMMLLWLIFSKVDILFLKAFKGDVSVAIYGAATYILTALMFIPANINNAVYPVLSRFFNSSLESLEKYYRKSFQYLFSLSLPVGVGITILARPIITVIWRGKYVESIPVLQILAWLLAIEFIASILGFLMWAANQQGARTVMMFWLTILHILLNLVLIPKLSYIGSAVAAVITHLLLLIALLIFISRRVCRINFAFTAKPVLATAIFGVFIYVCRNTNLFVLIPLGAMLYFSCLWLMKAFIRRDLTLIKSFLIKA